MKLFLLVTCFSISTIACDLSNFTELEVNHKVSDHIYKVLEQLSSKQVTSVESISFIKPFRALVKYKHKVKIEDSELSKSKFEKEIWTLSVNSKCKFFLRNISK